jgi:hypothetical protein
LLTINDSKGVSRETRDQEEIPAPLNVKNKKQYTMVIVQMKECKKLTTAWRHTEVRFFRVVQCIFIVSL